LSNDLSIIYSTNFKNLKDMKRFTRKASMLVVAMLILGSVFVHAEKRYVFALGGFPNVAGVAAPGWGADWVDYRLNDVDRVFYIWSTGNTLAGTPAVGTGSLGQTGYIAFIVQPVGWWGGGYYLGPDSGNPAATMDLTDVTSAWYLHFAIRTDCALDISVSLTGSTTDPNDPFIIDKSAGKFVMTTTNLPLAKRDKTTWTEFNVKLSDLAISYAASDAGGAAHPMLVYLAPLSRVNYLAFSGGNDTGSFVAWDNVYLTSGATAIDQVKADNLEIIVAGNRLTVNNNTNPVEVYSVSGARVISSKLNDIDISSLATGIYVVKAGNRVNKFNKL